MARKKYSDNGWQHVPDAEWRYTDAMFRHLMDEARGEDFDPDTGLLHAAHAAWNALARLVFIVRRKAVLDIAVKGKQDHEYGLTDEQAD